MNVQRITIGLFFASLLSGCAGFEDHASCTRIDGIAGCDSLSDLDAMSQNGTIAADEQGRVTRGYAANHDKARTRSRPTRALAVNAPPHASTPLRVPERTAHMLVFPFIDEYGNYHDTAHLDILLSKPYWSKPAATVIRHQEDEPL